MYQHVIYLVFRRVDALERTSSMIITRQHRHDNVHHIIAFHTLFVDMEGQYICIHDRCTDFTHAQLTNKIQTRLWISSPDPTPVREIHTQHTQSIDLLPSFFLILPLDPYLEDALLFR